MKRPLIFQIALLAGILAQGQYFVSEGSLWSCAETGTDGPPDYRFYWVRFEGDTMINGVEYKRIHKSFDSLLTHWESVGFIREDSIGRVYKIDDYYKKEVLSFDFSLGTGDSIFLMSSYYMHIDSVQNKPFGFDPSERKHIYYYLICYFEHGELIYHNEKFSNCFPVSTATMPSAVHKVKVMNRYGSIRFHTEGLGTLGAVFSVLDITGRLLHQRTLGGEVEWELPTTSLPSGVYIYRLGTTDGVLAGKFYIR